MKPFISKKPLKYLIVAENERDENLIMEYLALLICLQTWKYLNICIL